tara:strand:+ start:13407 stop:13907 length:501 start_codon:yes stop_codon:yes gene_type:complete
MHKLNYNFVTLFGIGNIKVAPGTFGSIFACLVLFILFHVLNLNNYLILFFLILITIFSLVSINIYLKESANKDPKEVVVDEFVGQSIPIFMYEISHGYEKLINDSLIFYFIIFILFRIYDIFKPFPINYIDKNLQNAIGVILDDVIAGIYTVVSLIIIILIKFYFL